MNEFEDFEIGMDDEDTVAYNQLMHIGTPRHSGRYKYGSGKDPFQHAGDFLSRVDELKRSGLSVGEIAKSMQLTSTQLKTQISIAGSERKMELSERAIKLKEKGWSNVAIAKEMGYANESSVRALLEQNGKRKLLASQAVSDKIREAVDSKGMVDVGKGVEKELGISDTKLKQAIHTLEMEGYVLYGGGMTQVNNKNNRTNMQVLCKPGTEHKEIFNPENVHSMSDYISYNDGVSFVKSFIFPSSMDSKRLSICYAEDGGIDKDGVIELRRGKEDLSLGSSNYSQVRILVDGKRYLKGMAVYADDLPDGVDVRFNTNKSKDVAKMDVLKKIKDDPDNPFGSLIKEHGGQSFYDDPNGKFTDPITGKKQSLSLINKKSDEGDWGEWSNKLPSQFLGKQNKTLINRQLKQAIEAKQLELDDIMSIPNPTVQKYLLKDFADGCDANAVHLHAAALPRQMYHVILPMKSIKEHEIYAPNYQNGEELALVRYPHGGTFEIPKLIVNNKLKEGKGIIGNGPDAVGISAKVAGVLSGADFDGDTVMCIPTGKNGINITATKPLDGLKDYDPKVKYGHAKKVEEIVKDPKTGKDEKVVRYFRGDGTEFKGMTTTNIEMGKASNLIMDMTIKGATNDELIRAVKHSMTVIDAEKHGLDYRQSYKDNNISALKKKYQAHYDEEGKYHESASTIFTRAKSEIDIQKRKGTPDLDKDGNLVYKTNDKTWTDDKGKVHIYTEKSTQMEQVKDAHQLSSGKPQEIAYANFANALKQMARDTRLQEDSMSHNRVNKEAKEKYKAEVADLNAQLNTALKNAPRERSAQRIANTVINAKKQENPDITKGEIKKIGQKALTDARLQVGAKREKITISEKAWEAIQAGAVSGTTLTKILGNTDMDKFREMITPKPKTSLTTGQLSRLQNMLDSKVQYSNSQIASALGVSLAVVREAKKQM